MHFSFGYFSSFQKRVLAGFGVTLLVLLGILWTKCGASCRPLAEYIPPATITDLSATPITGTSVLLRWTAHGDDGDEGRASFYEIRYARSPVTDEASFQAAMLYQKTIYPEEPFEVQLLNLSGLEPETTYYFAVKTGDDVGNVSALSNIAIATTKASLQGLSDLRAEEVAEDSLTVSWESPGAYLQEPDEPSVYDLRISLHPITNDDDFVEANVVPDLPPMATEHERQRVKITGLTPGTVYYLALAIRDDEGNVTVVNGQQSFSTATPSGLRMSQSMSEVSAGYVKILPSNCTTDPRVVLVLHADHAAKYIVASRPDFLGATWEVFPLPENRVVVKDWQLPATDGVHVVYAKYVSLDGQESSVFTEQVKLDKVHGCRTQAEQLFDLLSDQGASVAEVDPRCVSDVSHATVEPYIVRPDGTSVGWRDDRVRVTGLSSFETQYGFETGTDASFDDVVVHVIRVDNVASLHIVSLRGEPNLSIRYRVDAANLKRLDDRLLWKTGQTLPGPTYSEETISFTTYPELCPSVLVPHPHPGDVFKTTGSEEYVLGSDFLRHAFPSQVVRASWLSATASVLTVADYQVSAFPLGRSVTYRPGTGVYRMTGEKNSWYVVGRGPLLHKLADLSLAEGVFGSAGAIPVQEIDSANSGDYQIGSLINTKEALEALREDAATTTLDYWGDPDAKRMNLLTHALGVQDGHVTLLGAPYITLDPIIRLKILGKTGAVLKASDLLVEQEKPVHILVVRDDLSSFTTAHPEERDGVWTGTIHVPEEGFYYAYVDVVPKNGSAFVFREPLVLGEHPVSGTSLPKPDPARTARLGPYAVTLQSKYWASGQELLVAAHITKNGMPDTEIQQYQEGYGQFVLFKQHDFGTFLHTHALEAPKPGENVVYFRVRFPTPGRYTAFVDFQLDGALWTFPITFDIP